MNYHLIRCVLYTKAFGKRSLINTTWSENWVQIIFIACLTRKNAPKKYSCVESKTDFTSDNSRMSEYFVAIALQRLMPVCTRRVEHAENTLA